MHDAASSPDFLGWVGLVGGLLLLLALSAAYLRRLPISTSTLYLSIGLAIGPAGLGWLHIDLATGAPWLERLTELAVIVSLFIGGLKLRLPLRDRAWRAPFRLAGPLMLLSIVGVAALAHLALGLTFAMALLVAAVLAPTDPVLASDVSVNNASDKDLLRYGVSGEAGLNDGMAFPFVVLALEWGARGGAGAWLGGWALHRLVWGVAAALVLGYLLGGAVGHLAVWLRARHRDDSAIGDFLALALIALSYVAAQAISSWGFLAVFAAGVGLRRAEVRIVQRSPHPDVDLADQTHPPAEDLVPPRSHGQSMVEPAVSAGTVVHEVLSFGDTLERLLEILLVVLVGVALATHFDLRAVPVAVGLLLLRPPLAALTLIRTGTSSDQRWLMGWFGIRGIGSLYYLTYAITHGVSGRAAREACALVLTAVAASVLVHGVSAQPLLAWYERRLARAGG